MIAKRIRKAKKNQDLKKAIDLRSEKRKDWKKLLLSLQSQLVSGESAEKGLDVKIFHLMKALNKTAKYSKVKYRRRCKITNRPRGVTTIGICRNYIRLHAGFGDVFGVKKS